MNQKSSDNVGNNRSGKSGRRVFFPVIITLLIVIIVGGCRRSGLWLLKENVPMHADAMVVLMGSFPERVLQAVDLYREGKADRIIMVEEYMGPFRQLEDRGVEIVSNSEQAVTSLVTLGVPVDSIILLPGDARSTMDEVIAVRDYLKSNPSVDTLILVSSPAHTRRANMIFRTALRKSSEEVVIGCSPSRYSDFNPHKWWKRKEDIQSVLSEYVKIISFMLFEHKQLKQQT
jgi:uncharacterized SAM-binding protein YcdF (DUF218 family)